MTQSETEDLISQKKKVDKLEKKEKKTKKSKKKDSADEEEAKREKLARKKAKREKLERKEAKRKKLERKETKKSKATAGNQVPYQQEEGSREEVKEEEGARVKHNQVKDRAANKPLQGQVQQDEGSDGEDHQAEIKERKKSKQKKSKGKSDTVAQGMTGTKPMKEIVELPSGWIPIRHPEVPDMISSYYFVNQDESAIYSVARGKFVPIAPVRRLKALGPRYNIAGKTALKLEEIMAHTFLEHFDSSKHYILHKDGQAENCAWNNLIICYDLPTLQRHEIARLQKLYPDAKYTVVRNVHATSTFEHYLVSDTGNIYSLIERRHIHIGYCSAAGYLVAPLSTDIGIKQATKQFCRLAVHSVVMQSFNGSRTRERVFHINGNRLDNALINLTYIKSRTQTLEKEKVPVEEQAESSTRIMPLPSPPVTDNLKWKNVGVLPWDGQGYTQYEVSDMGHVRRKDTSEIVPFFVGKHGHTYVSMYKDCQGPKKYRSTRTVARLVANAFVDGYTGERDWVDHLNGDQHDNRALNLRWVHREKKPVCPIVVSLVDDPKIQREFRSTRKLQRELHVCDVKAVIEKYGGTFTKTIEWNGEKKLAQFRLLSSEENNK